MLSASPSRQRIALASGLFDRFAPLTSHRCFYLFPASPGGSVRKGKQSRTRPKSSSLYWIGLSVIGSGNTSDEGWQQSRVGVGLRGQPRQSRFPTDKQPQRQGVRQRNCRMTKGGSLSTSPRYQHSVRRVASLSTSLNLLNS
jgi:hypothetical protein